MLFKHHRKLDTNIFSAFFYTDHLKFIEILLRKFQLLIISPSCSGTAANSLSMGLRERDLACELGGKKGNMEMTGRTNAISIDI